MTRASRTPISAATAARQLVLAGRWRTLPSRDTEAKIRMALRSRHPWVLPLLPTDAMDALVALGQPGGRCGWCHAPAGLARNEITTAILGTGCGSCQIAGEAAAVLVRERPHVRQLVAAGFKPEASANLRSAEQVADYTRRLRALDRAKLPPRPTPEPAYYQRRPWPAGAAR